MILCSLFALLLLHFCFGFCVAFVLRLCHSEKPHRCPNFVPILSYPQELKRLIRKGETALLIVCHCEHTEKTLIFVPVLYRFCAYFFRFSSSLSVPMRSKPPKETLIFWLHFGTALDSAPSYRALRYGSPPRTFPGITADTGKKGDFCHGFDMVLPEREGADLPPPCHVFALDTIAVLLPHFCPIPRLFFACFSPLSSL